MRMVASQPVQQELDKLINETEAAGAIVRKVVVTTEEFWALRAACDDELFRTSAVYFGPRLRATFREKYLIEAGL